MARTVETLSETVDAELAELPADMRARLVRISELIESVGLPNVKEPHVRHIRGQLWEIRLKGKAGIARALYVTAREQRVVIVRAFIKKTEKTPTGEIETSRGERCRFGARPNRPASQCLLQSSATLVRIAAVKEFIRAVEGGGRPGG